MFNIATALRMGIRELQESGIQSSGLDSRILLSHVLGVDIEYLSLNSQNVLSLQQEETFFYLVSRRKKFEPIAYLIESKEFYGRNFTVTKDVLIPRPDTEIMIDAVLGNNLLNDEAYKILDLGTGSGCIIITLLLEIPNSYGVGIDISNAALSVAKKNAIIHNIQDKIEWIQSNWFDGISAGYKFDIIVSNPPYISVNERNLMNQEALLYEPHGALFADNDGLYFYEIIAQEAMSFLSPHGILLVEIGFSQKELVTQIFSKYGYIFENSYADLANYDRVLCFSKN